MYKSEISELLDSYKVQGKKGFHRLDGDDKAYFINRLYKIFDYKRALLDQELKMSGGLKLHFQTAGATSSLSSNTPTEAFLKKAAFYANHTVITYPFKDIASANWRWGRDGRSRPPSDRPIYFGRTKGRAPVYYTGRNETRGYMVDTKAFDEFLSVLNKLKPALGTGFIHLVPTFSSEKKPYQGGYLGLISANFNRKDLEDQFNEFQTIKKHRQRIAVPSLLLPHLTNVPFERIVEIRNKEEALYLDFQRRLENVIYNAKELDSETMLLSFLKEIDEGVREIRAKLDEVKQRFRQKNINLLIKFLAIGLVALSPPEARNALMGVIGGITAFDYLHVREERSIAMQEIKGNKFYLPWLVFRTDSDKKV